MSTRSRPHKRRKPSFPQAPKRRRGAPRFRNSGNRSLQSATQSIRMTQLYELSFGTGTPLCFRFNVNDIIQPEVGGPTLSMPGLTQYAGLYDQFLVLSYEYDAWLITNDPLPYIFYVINSTDDPGTAAPYTKAANRFCAYTMVSGIGGDDRANLKGKFSICQLVGSNAPKTADSYRGNTASVAPADLIWCGFGAQQTVPLGTPTKGVTLILKLTLVTKFYSPKQL